MSTNVSLDRMVGALTRAQGHWRARSQHEPRTRPAPTIALDRQAGTPGSEVAHALGSHLGWMVYDHELVEKIAQEMGLRTRLLESVDERHGGWVREAVREIMDAVSGVPSVSASEYAGHLLETLLSLSAHGGCVIVGRGAAQVLRPASTLRVKLVAPLDWRVEAVRQPDTSVHDAERQIREEDRQHTLFVRENFRKDPEDVEAYDLVLNAARWPVDDCVELIACALDRLQKQE